MQAPFNGRYELAQFDGAGVLPAGDKTRIEAALEALGRQDFGRRLWDKDPSLWRVDAEMAKVVRNRMGWLNVADTMTDRLDEILRFVESICHFKHAVLMGMGGSSLSPEVSRLTFGVKDGYPDLMILDSTVPAAVKAAVDRIDPASTLFIVSTKSGTTVETLSACEYFLKKVASVKKNAGENFIAITDPGTPLEAKAEEQGFRKVFLNFPDIGGRYSALSCFGIVPAAIIGADVKKILDRAQNMMRACGPNVEVANNPGVVLGTIMGELALMGRDKLTLILPQEIKSFGYWIEQLVAESTGKHGRGILPVEGESIADPAIFGDDRLFVHYKLERSADGLDRQVQALEEAGHPVVRFALADVYDLGAEYFRWEMATAVASALLGVEPFDQPNVKESKDRTEEVLGYFKEKGALPDDKAIVSEGEVKIFSAGCGTEASLDSCIQAFLNEHQPGNYFALMAFLHASPEIDEVFQRIRGNLQKRYLAATTLGYGPRFLHSTGQYHKGGPNNGLFIQFTADDLEDVSIPGSAYGFSVLKQAQAVGDAEAIRTKGRPFIRIHLGKDILGGLRRIEQLTA